jgi:parallel beta-helix repeat protein
MTLLGRFDATGRRQRADGNPRREFLRSCLLLALPVVAGCAVATAPSSAAWSAPVRARGSAQVNVRDKGAKGDGRHDDTPAFQAAIDALPQAGGTVEVPDGVYLIDAEASVRLRSRMLLKLSPGAKLIAKPNRSPRSFVLLVSKVSDVEISGGQIVGERAGHSGTEGEWGHGIQVRGSSRVTIRGIRVSDCWGDGLYVGAADPDQVPSDDVAIANVVSTGNRRQGLSIAGARNVHVSNSEFSNTAGTNPQYGIDIEPNRPGSASGIVIENCVIKGNRGGGIQIFRRVSDVTIRGCTIEDNHGRGILAVAAERGVIVGNVIRNNGLVGVALRDQTRDFQVNSNRFANNEGRTPGKAAKRKALNPSASAVRSAPDTQGITITGNLYDR